MQAEEGAAVSGLGVATSGGHIPVGFFATFSVCCWQDQKSQKDKLGVIELNIVEELKVLMDSAEVEPWRCILRGV